MTYITKTDNPMLNRTPATRFEPWIYAFILLHVMVWTLAPTLVRFTLPMDAIEGAIWGQHLQLGYDKNPFMNGWLTALASYVGAHSDAMIYFFSQVSVAICFLAVWELGKKIVAPIYAFIAVLSLEGLQYFNLHAIDFNDNTLEPGFWALTILFFYHALRSNKLRDWILTGLFAGCSMMTKYFAVMLFFPMLVFMALFPETRALFKKRNFYLGFIVFLIFIAPHFIWLFSHDFITVTYAFNRVSNPPTWWNHVSNPAQFAWEQIEVFLPMLVLLLIAMIGKTNCHASESWHPEKSHWMPASAGMTNYYNQMFLLIVGVGPFILTLLLSAVAGLKLRAGWGQPLLTYWGLTLLAWINPIITRARFQRFLIVWVALSIAIVVAYCVSLVRAPEPSSANFPGKIIANTLTKEWHDKYHTPLNYVVGPRWLAGNVAYYSEDHPSVYIDADKKVSSWIDESTLRHDGAIFVWDPTEEHQMSRDEVKAQFPNLHSIQVMHFTWRRNMTMTPVEISVAILPPEKLPPI